MTCGLFLNIWWDHSRQSLCVIIGRRANEGRDNEAAAPVDLKFVPWKAGEAAEPTIQIPKEMATEFLLRAAEAIKGTGVKLLEDQEALAKARAAEAELGAVRYHLEDLRMLQGLALGKGPTQR